MIGFCLFLLLFLLAATQLMHMIQTRLMYKSAARMPCFARTHARTSLSHAHTAIAPTPHSPPPGRGCHICTKIGSVGSCLSVMCHPPDPSVLSRARDRRAHRTLGGREPLGLITYGALEGQRGTGCLRSDHVARDGVPWRTGYFPPPARIAEPRAGLQLAHRPFLQPTRVWLLSGSEGASGFPCAAEPFSGL